MLNHIKASRQHSETDWAVIADGRMFNRRLRAAMRNAPRSRLATLSRRLNHYRREGFPSDLQWFLADYAEAISVEISLASWRAK